MFSLEYFKYLLKSRKYLLLFIFLITLLNILGTKDPKVYVIIQAFLSLAMTFVLPLNIFYYIHDRKAIDTFFSIPVSRKALLVTGLVFCILGVYLPFALSIVCYGIGVGAGLMIVVYLLEMLLAVVTLVVFHTLLYMIANNAIDGAVMAAAYTCIPLVLLFVLYSYTESFVCGMNNFDFTFVSYLSPIYLSGRLFASFKKISSDNVVPIGAIIGLIVILSISAYLLYRSYLNRAVERANTSSNGFFAYPAVIYTYAFMVLLLISSFFNFYYKDVFEFFSDFFIAYLLLFAVFVAAHFVYKRKFYFSYKLPLFYCVALVISIVFALVCRQTHGFGLSYAYPKNDYKAYYTMSCWYSRFENYNRELFDYCESQIGTPIEDVSVYVEANSKYHNTEINEETYEIFDEMRKDAINKFYEDHNGYRNIYLMISSSKDNNYYSYDVGSDLSINQLKGLAADDNVKVTIALDYEEYVMDKEGNLKKEIIIYQ